MSDRAAHRSTASLLAILALGGTAGCLGQTGVEDVTDDGVPALVVTMRMTEGLETEVVLENRSTVPIRPACGPWDCDEAPVLRIDALQESGEWFDRGDYAALGDTPAEEAWIGPGATRAIGTILHVEDRPGTFRIVVSAVDEGGATYEVSHEVAVVGWGDAALRAGRDILRRADAASCTLVRERLLAGLAVRVEPDALLDLERDVRDDAECTDLLLEMVRRGTFVHELVPRLTVAAMDDVRHAQRILTARGQPPVRRTMAARFFDLVADHGAPLLGTDYYAITDLDDVWPDGGAALLVERLVHGSDEGADLERLVETLRYSDRALFEAHRDTIVDALRARCAGAEGTLHVECEIAIEHFVGPDPVLGGRGYGTSSRCGFGFHESAVCRGLLAEWEALEAEAGELDVQDLGDHVERVERDVRAP